MSASLVGSEMCIRDRVEGVREGRHLPGEELGAREDGRPPGSAGGRRTVSYTHLTLPTICSV
eukprot:5723614-Alexandrium_andersonii.AAC.1